MLRGLSRKSPMVLILEEEYSKARLALQNILSRIIKTTIVLTIICTIIFGVVKDFHMMVGYAFAIILTSILLSRYIIKNIGVVKIGLIKFNELNNGMMINDEDVYETTRILCKMSGFIDGVNKCINFFIIISSILVISSVINFCIKLFIG